MNKVSRMLLLALAGGVLAGCQASNPYLRQRSIEAMERGRYDDAHRMLTQAVAQNGSDWKAMMLLGETKLVLGQPLDAQLLLERALTVREERLERDRILDGLAESFYRQKQWEKLHQLLDSSARDKGEWTDYLRQARYLTLMGDADGAAVAFRKTARFAPPGDVTPYWKMADFYRSIGDRDREIRSLRQALWVDPTNVKVIDRLVALGYIVGPTAAYPPDHLGEFVE